MKNYDYLLTGSTGQIGRYLLKELISQGSTVAVTMRRKDKVVALRELQEKTGLPLHDLVMQVSIQLGDLTDPDFKLPKARRVINAAGYTSLGGSDTNRYWRDNILTAVRLAHHAGRVDASLHQLSSVAVAEFREDILTEFDIPIPDERQLNYSASKVMVELSVSAISPYAQILRVGDAVPPFDSMESDFRSHHWLSILFRYGRPGFAYAPPNYNVWLADVSEMARALVLLTNKPGRCYHVLGGRSYSWEYLQECTCNPGREISSIPKWMTDIILHGPEARMVDNTYTETELRTSGFHWLELNDIYWKRFADRSINETFDKVKYYNPTA